MRNIIVLVCVLLFTDYSLAEGAFGTYKGMTRKQLENKGVIITKVNSDNSIVSKNAPIPNHLITEYVYYFDSKEGLCGVKGMNEYRNESFPKLKKDFDILNESLIEKYGSPAIKINKVSNKFNNNWFHGIIKDNDEHNASLNIANSTPVPIDYANVWDVKNKFTLILFPSLIRSIKFNNIGGGIITVVYSFPNCVSQKIDNSKGL